MLRLRLALLTLAVMLFFGASFAQAQANLLPQCFQDARDYLVDLYDSIVSPATPLTPPTPAPVPPNVPPPLTAAFYRFPIIQPGSQPQTWEELVYYAQSTGVTVDQTITEDEPSSRATILRPLNAPFGSGMPIIIRAGELGTDVYTAPDGEITQSLEGNAQFEAQSLETFGDWWHVRFAVGTEGWIRLSDAGLQPPAPVTVTVTTPTPLTVSPSENSAPIQTLEGNNQPVEAIGRDVSGNWFKVRTSGGSIGWIPASALQQNEQLEQARQQALSDGYSFRFTPPSGEAFCNLPSGMVLQTPQDIPVYAYVNTMPIELNGTAVITTSDISGDGADDTMFITVVDGQITTLMPDNPFTMTGIGETVGLELNEQGDIVGYTGVVPEEAQQREILVNATILCEINGFLYVRPVDCETIEELPASFADFITSVTETAAAAGEPDVPGLDETEIAALPEATAEPAPETTAAPVVDILLADYRDAVADVRDCSTQGLLNAPSGAALKADLIEISILDVTGQTYVPSDAPTRSQRLPYLNQRLWQVQLSQGLMEDISNGTDNYAIVINTRRADGSLARYIWEVHRGVRAYRGEILSDGSIVPQTASLVDVDRSGRVNFNLPDDIVEFYVQSFVEDTNRVLVGCDRYPETGYITSVLQEGL